MTNRTPSSRERGRTLLSQLNRWAIAGAIALAGLFSFAAAQSTHGKTTGASTTATTTSVQQPSSGVVSGGS